MARRMEQPLLLCGSLAGDTVYEVMQQWGSALGGRIAALPDGEVGYRSQWTEYLAHSVLDGHAGLQTVVRPPPFDPNDPDDWRGPDGGWIGLAYDEEWKFRVIEGTHNFRFERLGYADAALESYAEFIKLRDNGEISPKVRFQVCIPTHDSGLRWFLTSAADFELLWAPYTDVVKRELDTICASIPPKDLLVQWDVCAEILGYDPEGRKWFDWESDGEPLDRYAESIAALSPHVPDEVLLGVHLCYGSFRNQHLVEPGDLSYAVNMANVSVKHAGRRIDFVHMPVPIDRDDDAYYAALGKLEIAETKLYLGLLHADGVESNVRRVDAARRYVQGFGVGTECGLARWPRAEIPLMIDIHRNVADVL